MKLPEFREEVLQRLSKIETLLDEKVASNTGRVVRLEGVIIFSIFIAIISTIIKYFG